MDLKTYKISRVEDGDNPQQYDVVTLKRSIDRLTNKQRENLNKRCNAIFDVAYDQWDEGYNNRLLKAEWMVSSIAV